MSNDTIEILMRVRGAAEAAAELQRVGASSAAMSQHIEASVTDANRALDGLTQQRTVDVRADIHAAAAEIPALPEQVATVTVAVQDAQLRELEATLERLPATAPDVAVQVRAQGAAEVVAELARVQAEGEALAQGVTVPVTVTANAAPAQAEIDALPRAVDVGVRPVVEAAHAREAEAALAEIATRRTVDVRADVHAAAAEIPALPEQVATVTVAVQDAQLRELAATLDELPATAPDVTVQVRARGAAEVVAELARVQAEGEALAQGVTVPVTVAADAAAAQAALDAIPRAVDVGVRPVVEAAHAREAEAALAEIATRRTVDVRADVHAAAAEIPALPEQVATVTVAVQDAQLRELAATLDELPATAPDVTVQVRAQGAAEAAAELARVHAQGETLAQGVTVPVTVAADATDAHAEIDAIPRAVDVGVMPVVEDAQLREVEAALAGLPAETTTVMALDAAGFKAGLGELVESVEGLESTVTGSAERMQAALTSVSPAQASGTPLAGMEQGLHRATREAGQLDGGLQRVGAQAYTAARMGNSLATSLGTAVLPVNALGQGIFRIDSAMMAMNMRGKEFAASLLQGALAAAPLVIAVTGITTLLQQAVRLGNEADEAWAAAGLRQEGFWRNLLIGYGLLEAQRTDVTIDFQTLNDQIAGQRLTKLQEQIDGLTAKPTIVEIVMRAVQGETETATTDRFVRDRVAEERGQVRAQINRLEERGQAGGEEYIQLIEREAQLKAELIQANAALRESEKQLGAAKTAAAKEALFDAEAQRLRLQRLAGRPDEVGERALNSAREQGLMPGTDDYAENRAWQENNAAAVAEDRRLRQARELGRPDFVAEATRDAVLKETLETGEAIPTGSQRYREIEFEQTLKVGAEQFVRSLDENLARAQRTGTDDPTSLFAKQQIELETDLGQRLQSQNPVEREEALQEVSGLVKSMTEEARERLRIEQEITRAWDDVSDGSRWGQAALDVGSVEGQRAVDRAEYSSEQKRTDEKQVDELKKQTRTLEQLVRDRIVVATVGLD